MPALVIPFLIGGAIGGVVGFATADGLSSFARATKYAAIGGGLFVAYKVLKG